MKHVVVNNYSYWPDPRERTGDLLVWTGLIPISSQSMDHTFCAETERGITNPGPDPTFLVEQAINSKIHHISQDEFRWVAPTNRAKAIIIGSRRSYEVSNTTKPLTKTAVLDRICI